MTANSGSSRDTTASPPDIKIESLTTPSPTDEQAVVLFNPGKSQLRSRTTDSLPEILSRLGASVLVSTYQSGSVAAVRAAAPGQLNTHSR